MKKFFAAALAVALTFAMSVTAFAADSIKVGALDVTVAEGNATVTTMTPEAITTYKQALLAQQADITAALGVQDLTGVSFYGFVDVQGTASEANPLTVTFNVPGVKATDIVNILHLKADGTIEVLPGIAGNGTVTGTFTSLSPVTFAVQAAAAVNPPTDPVNPEQPVVNPEQPTVTDPTLQPSATDPTTNDAAPEAPADANTSPKTADNGIALFVIAGLAAAAGIVAVSRRKVEE